MTYSIEIFALGEKDAVEINADKFNELKAAKTALGVFFDLTENFRVVLEAYRQLERIKHEVELDHIFYAPHSYEDSADVRVALTAPVFGYLTSARFFLDATNRLLPDVLAKDEVTAFKAMRTKIYDATAQYRFVEGLRNYSQHRETPLHMVTLHNFVEDLQERDSDLVTALSLFVDRELLSQDEKFKKVALDGMPEKINLMHCLRFHMEMLWHQHAYLLKHHSEVAEAARGAIKAAREQFRNATGKDVEIGLHAIATADNGDIVDKVSLLLLWDDARRSAIKRIGNLNNLHRRYVTGKIQKP